MKYEIRFDFPKDFMFGVATSAVQIEGAHHVDGKGEDTWMHRYKADPAKCNYADPDTAAGFYHTYPEDIKLMKELGVKCFRFSISWSRIFPNGPAEVNQAGIDHYNKVIDELKKNGIKTFFDLWHCDLPWWVVALGGLTNSSFGDWFTSYAKTCFEAFGDRIDYWCTVNEPNLNAVSETSGGPKCFHNMILAHYRTIHLYKSMGLKGKIGAVLWIEATYPFTTSENNRQASRNRMAAFAGRWLQPMFEGTYPDELINAGDIDRKVKIDWRKDLEEYFIPCDFIGVNYYSSRYVEYGETEYMNVKVVPNSISYLPTDDYGFGYYPQGLYDVLMYLHEHYPDKEIIITENGVGKKRLEDLDADLHDSYRVQHMREHLRSLSRAIKAGAKVVGYLPWTFLDTNEGAHLGFDVVFGLVQINRETFERRPRDSYYYYQNVIKENRVD